MGHFPGQGRAKPAEGDVFATSHSKAPARWRALDGRWYAMQPRYSSNRFNIRQAFCPPSPNELDMVTRTSALRATLGT